MPYPSCHSHTSSPDTFPGGHHSWRTGNRVPEPGHSAEPSNHHCERWSRRHAGHFGSGHSTDHWPATDENWGWHRQTDKSREYDLSCCRSGYQWQTDITCTQITNTTAITDAADFTLSWMNYCHCIPDCCPQCLTRLADRLGKTNTDRSFTTYPPSKAQQQQNLTMSNPSCSHYTGCQSGCEYSITYPEYALT